MGCARSPYSYWEVWGVQVIVQTDLTHTRPLAVAVHDGGEHVRRLRRRPAAVVVGRHADLGAEAHGRVATGVGKDPTAEQPQAVVFFGGVAKGSSTLDRLKPFSVAASTAAANSIFVGLSSARRPGAF